MIIERHAAGADGRDDAQDFRPVGRINATLIRPPMSFSESSSFFRSHN
jgi:hypothetical protein